MALILILETGQNPFACAIAALLCRGEGHTTELHALGHGLPPWLVTERPDLVLIDVPDAYGEMGRCLRAEPALSGVPLIALTKRIRPQDPKVCAAGAFNEVIASPLRPSALQKAIAQLLGAGAAPLPLSS